MIGSDMGYSVEECSTEWAVWWRQAERMVRRSVYGLALVVGVSGAWPWCGEWLA